MLDRTLRGLEAKLLPIALLLCRLSLGGLFLLSGWFKVLGELNDGPGSFRNGYYAKLEPAFVPGFVSTPYGYALPWIELALGVLLLLGLLGREAALGVALVLVSILISQVNAYGLSAMGEPGAPFNPNYVLLTLALLLVVTGPGRLSVDGRVRGRKRK